MPRSNQRWFPTKTQIATDSEKVIRQVLTQHYALQDKYDALAAKVGLPTEKPSGPPPGSGPTDTQICGLFVVPIDTQTLANGALLRYDKTNGNFRFS